jgi:putative peptidoglycan lipid II flippase
LLAGVALWIAAQFDWIGLQAHPFQRIGALLIVIAVSGVTYFGALLAMGLRLKEFKRMSI